MPKDFLGRDLKEGDKVVYINFNYREFSTAKIARFTPCFAFFTNGYKQRPEQLIKVVSEEC
jgi:hypothetical protein